MAGRKEAALEKAGMLDPEPLPRRGKTDNVYVLELHCFREAN